MRALRIPALVMLLLMVAGANIDLLLLDFVAGLFGWWE